MQLKTWTTWNKAAGMGHQETLYLRLIYEVQLDSPRGKRRPLWFVDLPWTARWSPLLLAKAGRRAAARYLRTYGRDLLSEEWTQIVGDFARCHEAELNKAEDLKNLKK